MPGEKKCLGSRIPGSRILSRPDKLVKQYLLKKVTLPWESNPGPTPIRGDLATLVASVDLFYHLIMGKIGPTFSHLLKVRAEGADPPPLWSA